MGTRTRSQVALVTLALGASIAGCGSPLVVDEPKIGDNDEQQATCKVAKDPLNPMIIEWPGTSKVDFDVRSRAGLVAVSYAGCTLKVLPRCNIGGSYKMQTVTPARDRFEMATATDLYARLPVGAAGLKAELSQGAKLELDYVAVGQRIAETEPSPGRNGECDGATHYVATVTVGAYSLDARASGSAGAGVDIAAAGVGAKRSEGVKRVRGSGDVDACTAKPDAPECGAVIQLGLAPLRASAQTTATVGTNVVKGLCPTGMVSISGGTFKLGERGDTVSVRSYCLDLTEVTVAAYARCVKTGACSAEHAGSQFFSDKDQGKGACNWEVAGREKHPMNCADWGMAAMYCKAQGARLPTEEEWEWAARGGSQGRTYPWGNAEPDVQLCWSGISKRSTTCAVGSFPDGNGRGGLQDLAGNVWEWTSGKHDANSAARVARGGSWIYGNPGDVRASNRFWNVPSKRYDSLGFRCAK